jgi:hypothetical protein
MVYTADPEAQVVSLALGSLLMPGLYVQAELLTALWKLSAGPDERLPTSHGILDRALRECKDSLPDQLTETLSFGITGVGLRCYELPQILMAAQEAMLTTEPNPTYLSTIVTLDEERARQIVVSNGISTARAREIGRKLVEAVRTARNLVDNRPLAHSAA